MKRKTIVAAVAGLSTLALAATCIPASAYGHHGNHRGDMQLGLLAHAAGLNKDQIHSAFKNDTALKTDFENFKKAKSAVDSCIVAGTCTNEIATYSSAQQALTQEKMTVWQNLFKGAPNKSQAVSLKGQLDQLHAQKHQIIHQVFGSANGTDSATAQAAQQ
jgi:hypothetical protein